MQWPSRQKARLLVKVALHQIGHIYHLVLRKSTLEKLEEIYQTGDFSCTVHQCKFFALFAFGEAYTLRTEPLSGCRVPGTSYFARALSLVQILPERTSIIHLETLLLLVCLPNINPYVKQTNYDSHYSPTISTAAMQHTSSSAAQCASASASG